MRVIIEGYDLPGRRFCDPSGGALDDVQVGVQVRRDPVQLVPADAETARWELDISVVEGPDGRFDFTGGAVHGRRDDRFLYLTWGNVTSGGGFDMFRRAKLMHNRVDPQLIGTAARQDRALIGRVRLSDDLGAPRCARVDPRDLRWATS